LGLDAYSDDFRRLLRYGRGVDITRLEHEVGHRPRYSTAEALEDWVAAA
jgi:UDP-glucose 4-epimerase